MSNSFIFLYETNAGYDNMDDFDISTIFENFSTDELIIDGLKIRYITVPSGMYLYRGGTKSDIKNITELAYFGSLNTASIYNTGRIYLYKSLQDINLIRYDDPETLYSLIKFIERSDIIQSELKTYYINLIRLSTGVYTNETLLNDLRSAYSYKTDPEHTIHNEYIKEFNQYIEDNWEKFADKFNDSEPSIYDILDNLNTEEEKIEDERYDKIKKKFEQKYDTFLIKNYKFDMSIKRIDRYSTKNIDIPVMKKITCKLNNIIKAIHIHGYISNKIDTYVDDMTFHSEIAICDPLQYLKLEKKSKKVDKIMSYMRKQNYL